jgi:gas vesicle protein
MNRVCGFLTGIGAGLGLGLLLAPRSGERTRLLLRRRASDGADYLRQRSTDVRDAAAEALRDGTRRVVKGTDAVKAAVEAGKHAYSQTIRS